MNTGWTAVRRGETLRLVGACVGFLALAAVLGTTVNVLRPEVTRLPLVGYLEHHIETKAFRAGIPMVFLAGARERVNNPATMIFDARVPEQFEAGHLPRAHNLPAGEVDQRIGRYVSLLAPETSILVYCGGADCSDALELAVKLREIGFKDLMLYPGGYAEWTEYGEKVNTGGEP